MILDHEGNTVGFAADKQQALAKINDRIEERIRWVLGGREPAEGEVEQKGKLEVQPNGNWAFTWEDGVLLRVLFERGKIRMLNE